MADALTRIDELPGVPERPADGHKGTFGTVIAVGGCSPEGVGESVMMVGAPALVARAALRAGSGLVKIAAPRAVLASCLMVEPSATGLVLDRLDAAMLSSWLGGGARAVLAVGCGMGTSAWSRRRWLVLIGAAAPLVLDADGLNMLAMSGRRLRRSAPTLLTPHPGEYRRLAWAAGLDPEACDPTDPARRPQAAAALARHHDAVVLLKGAGTVVSDGRRYRVNETGGPALATAGSGDVLTGLIAALLAAGMGAFDAASLAAHMHGAAADAWSRGGSPHGPHGPRGLRALELADELTPVLNAGSPPSAF